MTNEQELDLLNRHLASIWAGDLEPTGRPPTTSPSTSGTSARSASTGWTSTCARRRRTSAQAGAAAERPTLRGGARCSNRRCSSTATWRSSPTPADALHDGRGCAPCRAQRRRACSTADRAGGSSSTATSRRCGRAARRAGVEGVWLRTTAARRPSSRVHPAGSGAEFAAAAGGPGVQSRADSGGPTGWPRWRRRCLRAMASGRKA